MAVIEQKFICYPYSDCQIIKADAFRIGMKNALQLTFVQKNLQSLTFRYYNINFY